MQAISPRSPSLPTATFAGSRRSSNVVTVVDDPDSNMSPPLSPDREKSEEILDDITVDEEESVSRPSQSVHSSRATSPAPSASTKTAEAEADSEMQTAEDSSKQEQAATRPLRLLEDEPDHLHRNLVLTDFEVKGTLGTSSTDYPSFRRIAN